LVEKTEWKYNLDLVKLFDDTLKLEFKKPLISLDNNLQEKRVIFHVGFGGSSDTNLSLDDYLSLAKSISDEIEVVFTFGPDDDLSKEYITRNLTFKAIIKDDIKSLVEFTRYINKAELFVSTSTGPMHLAGLTNTRTLSFFGNKLFASSKRWATISEEKYQNNYEIPDNYNKEFYNKIQKKLMELIS